MKLRNLALAVGLVAAISAAPLAEAQARDWHGGSGWHHGGRGDGALVGGLLAGGLITAALLDRPRYYYDDPYYYPPPRVVYADPYYAPPPRVVYEPGPYYGW